MRKRILSLTVAAALGALVGNAALAQQAATAGDATMTTQETTTTTTTVFERPGDALSEDAIKGDIAQAGYKEVKGLEFDDGVWQAKARGGNDNWVRIKVAPVTGKVYQADAPSRLDQDEIKAKLTAQGFQNIRDVKFDDGLWNAEASSARGHDVDLLVDPDDGGVVARSRD